MKVVSILGARPQFVKAAPVTRALNDAGIHELIVHTGQHYDYSMSQIFFEELGLTPPAVNLEVGSASHAQQTGRILIDVEEVLIRENPDLVIVYGDTNSTLAGALAACKMRLRLCHVEAGLRSFNREMPEEHNRVLADHCADVLLCPTQTAVRNLAREGITKNVHWVGDTMYDAVLHYSSIAECRSRILDHIGVRTGDYFLATIHRPYNTDDPKTLQSLFETFGHIDAPVIIPLHPRTRQLVNGYQTASNVRMIDPVGYHDMLVLERHARSILTDSGGVQKEAFFLGVPCITLRPETEWVETVDTGWNVVAGTNQAHILAAVEKTDWPSTSRPALFGDGNAAQRIVEVLESVCA